MTPNLLQGSVDRRPARLGAKDRRLGREGEATVAERGGKGTGMGVGGAGGGEQRGRGSDGVRGEVGEREKSVGRGERGPGWI